MLMLIGSSFPNSVNLSSLDWHLSNLLRHLNYVLIRSSTLSTDSSFSSATSRPGQMSTASPSSPALAPTNLGRAPPSKVVISQSQTSTGDTILTHHINAVRSKAKAVPAVKHLCQTCSPRFTSRSQLLSFGEDELFCSEYWNE